MAELLRARWRLETSYTDGWTTATSHAAASPAAAPPGTKQRSRTVEATSYRYSRLSTRVRVHREPRTVVGAVASAPVVTQLVGDNLRRVLKASGAGCTGITNATP